MTNVKSKIRNCFLVHPLGDLIFNTLLKTINHLNRPDSTLVNHLPAVTFFYCEPGRGTFAHFPHPPPQTGVSSAVKY